MTDSLQNQQDSTPTRSIRQASSWPELADDSDREALLKYMDDRFGISAENFDDYLIYTKKRNFWFIHNSTVLPEAAHLKIKRLGIKAFQEVGRFMKPTTRIIQCFGHLAKKSCF